MKRNQKGFGLIGVVIVIVVLGVVGYLVVPKLNDNKQDDSKSASNQAPYDAPEIANPGSQNTNFIWRQTADGWEAQGKVPDCPAQPMLKAPANLSQATSVLYPGQTRGGTSYKSHGGLRFNNSTDNKINVTAPIDGFIIRGVRHIADGGSEVQYGFTIMNNCGIATVIGHLRELTPALQSMADTFPEPTQNSATQQVNPPVYVMQGQLLATKVGILGDHNTFFDWGVYDYRQRNEASKSAAYQAAHGEGNGKDTAWNAVCWLQQGWLPAADEATLAKLPAGDPTSGKKSDYCK